MDPKLIEKYMAAMEKNGIKRMIIKHEGMEIELEREVPLYAVGTVSLPSLSPQASLAAIPTTSSPVPPLSLEKQEGKYITSPMIGTFYAASSPGAPPLVKGGDMVSEDTVVCIVEAMKVMNEIKAGVKGIISEVLVKNGEPIDFGTKLFKVV